MLAIALHFMIVSCTEKIDWKQAHFVPVEKESDSAKRKLIATFQSPIELACSQKCLHHEKCKYKKFDLKTSTCDLLEEKLAEVIDTDAVYLKTKTAKKEKVLARPCKVCDVHRLIISITHCHASTIESSEMKKICLALPSTLLMLKRG